jgi:hypothetical protein
VYQPKPASKRRLPADVEREEKTKFAKLCKLSSQPSALKSNNKHTPPASPILSQTAANYTTASSPEFHLSPGTNSSTHRSYRMNTMSTPRSTTSVSETSTSAVTIKKIIEVLFIFYS